MKRATFILVLIICAFSFASAQDMVLPNKPFTTLNSNPGYITIDEFTTGFGLGVTDVPYSKGFWGFTTLHGYQVNKSFIAAAGTGIYFYGSDILIPLFLDFRYNIRISNITPYVFADGGLLLNPSDFNGGTKLFINPGAGARYTFSKKIAVNLGAGLLIQSGLSRDSFINIKMGMVYKF